MRYFPSGTFRRERNYRSFNAEHYRCDLPTDVSLWPGLPLSLSGDEVMPLDYHAGRSGWLLYGRGRISNASPSIKPNWAQRWSSLRPGVEDYQVIRPAGS